MKTLLDGLTQLVKIIGDLPNTFWGVLILFSSMYMAVKFNSDIGYYFAGIGSTLLGINHIQPPAKTVVTQSSDPTELKVETNASNTAS